MWSAVIVFLVMLATALLTYFFCKRYFARQYKEEISRLELANSRLEANLKNSKNTTEEYQTKLIQLKDAGINIDKPAQNALLAAPLAVDQAVLVQDKAIPEQNKASQPVKKAPDSPADSKTPDTKVLDVKASDATGAAKDLTLKDGDFHKPFSAAKVASADNDQADDGVKTKEVGELASVTKPAGNLPPKAATFADVPVAPTDKPAAPAEKTNKSKKSESKPAKSTSKSSKDNAGFDAKVVREIMGKRIKKDDLKAVEGIGPKIADLFAAAGIETWQQLADAPVTKCQEVLDGGGGRYAVHNPQTWPKQASLAAKGDWQALKELQNQLKGGRPA